MSPAQQEQLLNIGAYLQSIRRDQGKEIDEVANQIFIRPALVKAIELGDWSALPEPVFVQGFILRYANYLGLDGREISQQFESTPVSVLPDPKLASDNGTEGIVSRQDKHGLKVISRADSPKSNTARPQNRPKLLWLLGLPAIAGLAVVGLWLFNRDPLPTAIVPETPEKNSVSPPPEGTASSIPAGVAAPSEATDAAETDSNAATESTAATADQLTNSAPITFQVNLQGDSWMRVVVDGEEVYEGILPSGAQQSWTAQNELTIRAGNSGAVLYSFNGGDKLPLGEPGTVSGITVTPETDPQTLQSQ